MNAEPTSRRPETVAPRRLPPPPPAELRYGGRYARNPLTDATFAAMCRRLPSVLAQTARMAWAIDRQAVLLLAPCQLAVGVSAALLLMATSRAMHWILAAGAVRTGYTRRCRPCS